MSLYDFYMYLKYIEYSSENLEFYVWYGVAVVTLCFGYHLTNNGQQVQELRGRMESAGG
jgi:hypothetical protein